MTSFLFTILLDTCFLHMTILKQHASHVCMHNTSSATRTAHELYWDRHVVRGEHWGWPVLASCGVYSWTSRRGGSHICIQITCEWVMASLLLISFHTDASQEAMGLLEGGLMLLAWPASVGALGVWHTDAVLKAWQVLTVMEDFLWKGDVMWKGKLTSLTTFMHKYYVFSLFVQFGMTFGSVKEPDGYFIWRLFRPEIQHCALAGGDFYTFHST